MKIPKLNSLKQNDPEIFSFIDNESIRQNEKLELIASENFVSRDILEAVGSILTNKYAEGYPGKRYYGGCEWVDKAENLAIERGKKLFECDHINVQPHSGSQANSAVFQSFLKPGDTILGLDLAHGGHLTHGSQVNFSGKIYNSIFYQVEKDTGRVDFNKLFDLAKKIKPKIIICGGSAYPRFIEFEKFREIADKVGSYLMADIAHPSGLVAAKLHPSPWPHCHIATSTTHKTLRGPRGGIILVGKDWENKWNIVAPRSGRVKKISEILDANVMPGIQGGPLMHVIAAKAIAFKEALNSNFKVYAENIVKNAKHMAIKLIDKDYKLITGGTDTHVILIDLTNKNISGKKAEICLEKAGITVNKNMVPYDTKSPFITSGIRIGTAAMTTRGMGINEMDKIVDLIDCILSDPDNEDKTVEVLKQVKSICLDFPLYE